MISRTKKILLTRPLEASRSFAADLEKLGIESVISPVLDVKALDFKWPHEDDYEAIILTSAHAARTMKDRAALLQTQKPVFCVGDQTAKAAINAGFENVKSAGGDLLSLETLLQKESYETYVYPAGKVIKRMPAIHGASVVYVPVYDAAPVHCLSDDAITALKNGDLSAVMFFSPRSAGIFMDLAKKAGCTSALKSIKALCIRDSVLNCLEEKMWQEVHCAAQPNAESMLDMAQTYTSSFI